MFLQKKAFYALIQKVCDNGYQYTFQQVKGYHAKHDQRTHTCNGRIDGSAHAYDGFQRHTEQLRKLGDQIVCVKHTAENCHAQGAQSHAADGRSFALANMVENRSRQNEAAAYHKVCKVAHKGRSGALQQELQNDLGQLGGHARNGPQEEGTDHHRYLAEVDLK